MSLSPRTLKVHHLRITQKTAAAKLSITQILRVSLPGKIQNTIIKIRFKNKNILYIKPFFEKKNRFPPDVKDIYNKTISYLRNNHASPEIKDGDEIISKQQENMSMMNIDILLEEEIEKYNRLKSQKQKEAKFFYEEETKRMKLLENMRMREEKLTEIKQKSIELKVDLNNF